MPQHDPVPPRRPSEGATTSQGAADVQRERAWKRYKALMSWMSLAAIAAAALALAYLHLSGSDVTIHMAIATVAGVGLSVLLGTGLMGLVYFSSHSGHDESLSRRHESDGSKQ